MRIIIAVLAIISLLAFMGTAESAPQSFTANVAWVYPLGDGSVILAFTQESPYCTAAGSPKYYLVMSGQNGVTADGIKSILATALTAFALGKPVSVVFDDATSNCYINRIAMMGP